MVTAKIKLIDGLRLTNQDGTSQPKKFKISNKQDHTSQFQNQKALDAKPNFAKPNICPIFPKSESCRDNNLYYLGFQYDRSRYKALEKNDENKVMSDEGLFWPQSANFGPIWP